MAEQFSIKPLHAPLGAEVLGCSPQLDFDDEQVARLKAELAQHHALVFRGEPRNDDAIVALAHRFGKFFATPGLERPALIELRHDPQHAAHALKANDFEWHTDGATIPGLMGKETFLEGVQVTKKGGNTYLVSTYEVYRELPTRLKVRLDGVRAVHDALQYKIQAGFTDLTAGVAHPLVSTHPDSGNRFLFLQPYSTVGILDLPVEEAQALLYELIDRVLQPERIYQHDWRVGDLLLFDQAGTWHRRDAWDPAEPRVLKMANTWYEVPLFTVPAGAPSADLNDHSQYRYNVTDSDLDQRAAALAWARRQGAKNLADQRGSANA